MKRCAVGGVENRIDNITKMTESLSEAVDHISDKTGCAAGGTSLAAEVEVGQVTAGMANDEEEEATGRQQRRVNQKPRYKPLDTQCFQEMPFHRYLVMKFNEQSKPQMNPYALINTIKENTGNVPKAVTGNNRISFTIETQNSDLQGIQYKRRRGISV